MAFAGVSMGKARQARVGSLRLGSLNNVGGLPATGTVPFGLLPGSGVIKAEEHGLLEYKGQGKLAARVGAGGERYWFACQRPAPG